MKSTNTKRALLMSVLSMMLCVVMLVGSTFAWFTDSVTSGKNKIVSGNLDVELYSVNGTTETPVTGTTNLFLKGALWEPGHVEVINLKIANLGTLALTYKFGINVAREQGGVNIDGDNFKLSDYIKFALIDGNQTYDSREAAIAAADAKAVALSALAVNEGDVLYPAGTEDKVSEKYVTLVVYMPTTVGNEANYRGEAIPTIDLGVNLVATQTPYESDSFGTDYDENVPMTVNDADEFRSALTLGGDITVSGTMNPETTVPFRSNGDAEFVFDSSKGVKSVSGGSLILDQDIKYGLGVMASKGDISVSDMKIDANSQWSVYVDSTEHNVSFKDVEIVAHKGAGFYTLGSNGYTELNNVKVNHEHLDDAYAPSTPWAATAVAVSSKNTLVINSGTYVGQTYAVYGYNSGSTVTINDGNYKAATVLKTDGSWSDENVIGIITVNGGSFDGKIEATNGYALITINDGVFKNFSFKGCNLGKLVINGGTFDADPTSYVAASSVVTNNNDGTWSVAPAVDDGNIDDLLA